MRLISLHEDAVRALERLRVPFDDVTPEGLWGSPYHLIGVTGEQRAVLDAWNLEVNDVTPQVLSAADVAPQLKESWPQPRPRPVADTRSDTRSEARGEVRTEVRETRGEARGETANDVRQSARQAHLDTNSEPSTADAEVPVPMHEEPKKHGDPLGEAAVERELVQRAAAAAEARSETTAPTKGSRNGSPDTARAQSQHQDPTRLRVSVGGKYREASVQQGKILLDGQSYDSPAAATKSVAPSKGDWVFWEYFDADAGKWRMLDRDWQPGHAS
jgi:hypothetical protein